MELRHLRYFCAVAEALNFSRASERLRVAQSALSRQIRDLENELGFKLFIRTTSSVRLTDAGRAFFISSQKILGQVALAVSAAQEVAKGKCGDLNIASDWRIPMDLVPGTVRKFRQRNPNVTVNFVDLYIADQLEALRRGKIHIAFLPDLAIASTQDIELMPVYTSDIVALLPTFHPLADRTKIPLRELASERWIVGHEEKAKHEDFRSYLIQMCRPAGFTPKLGRATGTVSGMLALVGAGEGIGLVPECVVPPGFGGVRAVKTDSLPMKLYATWLKKESTPLVAQFLEILRKEIKALGRDPKR